MEATIATTSLPGPRMCPECGAQCDDATGAAPGRRRPIPKPGDATLCAYCGTFLCFMPAMILRHLTDAEFNTLSPIQRSLMKGLQENIRKRNLRASIRGGRRAPPAPPHKG